MTHGYIYAIQNKINGKFYIGQTTRNPQLRWQEHIRGKDPTSVLDKALLKYGKHNFVFSKIDEGCNQEELDQLEESYICLFGSKITVNGYNVRDGGSNGKLSKKTRQKMSNSTKGKNNPMYGKTHNEEIRQKISNARKGRKHSLETRQKMSKSRVGNKNGRYLDLDEDLIVYLYIEKKMDSRKIAKLMNCTYGTIIRKLKNNNIKIRSRRDCRQNKGLFGFTGVHYLVKKGNPWTKVWVSRIGWKKEKKILGYFNDPLSAEIVYKMVTKEVKGG